MARWKCITPSTFDMPLNSVDIIISDDGLDEFLNLRAVDTLHDVSTSYKRVHCVAFFDICRARLANNNLVLYYLPWLDFWPIVKITVIRIKTHKKKLQNIFHLDKLTNNFNIIIHYNIILFVYSIQWYIFIG